MNALVPHAHWFLRFALASVFAYHGLTKFGALEMMAESMGMPVFMIALLGAMETLAAVLIIAGGVAKEWMTKVGAAIIAVVMIAAIFMVHLQHGWNSIGNMGMEFQVTLLMIALFFIIRGNSANAAV